MDRIVRIFSAGKALEAINQEIAQAIQNGSRVLIKVGSGPDKISDNNDLMNDQTSDSMSGAIASWAEGLSQEHGLVWQRVGPDVLFARSTA